MLMQFDPFREFDRLTEQLWGGRGPMPMDAYRHGDELVAHFDLPGVDPDSIEVTVEQNVLNVAATRQWPRDDGVEAIASERPQGTFTRQLFLGDNLDHDHVDASCDRGVLTVRIPGAERDKPRKVQITAGAAAKQLEASSTAA